ncbi:conserved hypothetical protein [Beggiatoa sp. PS]|nr:conserved hypothetical protein [Beggiatoa sp. PS]
MRCRLRKGFTIQEFTENTGLNFALIEKTVEQACVRGWLITEFSNHSHSKRVVCTTEMGMRFLNDVLDLFVP